MRHSDSVVRMMELNKTLSRHTTEQSHCDIHRLFMRNRELEYYHDTENIFPGGMNIEELKRIRSINASLDDVGYDYLLEKFLKNIVSRRTFNFFKNE